MTRLPFRFTEDLEIRNAARAVLTDDIERLRANLGERGIASRVSSGVGSTIAGRVRAGARDLFAQASARAGDHKGVLTVLIGAIILWFGRGSIVDWFNQLDADSDDQQIDPIPQTSSAQTPSEGDPA